MQCPNCKSKRIHRSGNMIVDISEQTGEHGDVTDYSVGDWNGYVGTAKCSCRDCGEEWKAAGEYAALRRHADNPWQTQWSQLFPTIYDFERSAYRIKTPLTYPTGGDRICVYVRQMERDHLGNEIVITDLGDTAAYLAGLGRNINEQELASNLQIGVGLDDSQLVLRMSGERWLAWNVVRLAQVISDITAHVADAVFGGELHIPEATS